MNNYIKDLELNIIYSSRKSIAIELKPDTILVRAPKGMSRREINSFLNEKRSWIEKHMAKMQVDVIVNTANPKPKYSSGTDTAVYKAAGEENKLRDCYKKRHRN